MSIASLLTNNTKSYLKLNVESINVDSSIDIGGSLKVDVIEELTPLANIRVVNKMQVDTIVEDTPLAGVTCESEFKCDSLSSRTSDTIVMSNIIKTNRIEQIVGTSVEINEIDTNKLSIQSGDTLRIERPIAVNIGAEYSQYSFDFLNVTDNYVNWSNIFSLNTGHTTNYLPPLVGSEINVHESGAGIYQFFFKIQNNSALGALETWTVDIVNGAGIPFASGNSTTGNDTPSIGTFWITGGFASFLGGVGLDKFKLRIQSNNSIAPAKNWLGDLTILRLK